MQILQVDLGARSYPIFIGPHLLGDAKLIRPYIKSDQVAIVSNETIAPLYLDKVKSSLSGLQVSQVILPDGEKYKNLDILNRIFDQLLADRHNRDTTLIALGGGVVGDMTGFAAASYQRGVNFVQIPTTLLSQVDSSVGGKTGVNHALGKNMIGAFHQPQCVIADTETLNTLAERELSAGLAEVIKYGLLKDKTFYEWLQVNISALMARESAALTYSIKRSCEIKADIVAEDEREAGVRALLNLGHTFGHAIETCQGYGEWLHGEAVAAGMVMAADLSWREQYLDQQEIEDIKQLLKRAKLPITAPEAMAPETFIDIMLRDKKTVGQKLRLILLKSVGEAIVVDNINKERLNETLKRGYKPGTTVND